MNENAKNHIKRSPAEIIFSVFNYTFIAALMFVMIYPLWYVLMASFSDAVELSSFSGFLFKPLGFSTDAYRLMMKNPMILRGDGDPWAPYSRDWYTLTCKDIQKNKHLKNSANKISIKHFKDEKFLMLKSGNSMNYYGFKICNEAGFVPNTSIYFDQLMTSYNMSASGLGICFVTDTLVKEVAANDNLLYYKIDSDFAERTVYLLRKKKRYLNRAVKEFIDVALCVYGELKNLP